MRKPRKATPSPETMESRTLLSGVAELLATIHAAVATTRPTAAPLHGSMHGTVAAHNVTTSTKSDGTMAAGRTTYDITAYGKVAPIGGAKVSGNLTIAYASNVSMDGFVGTLQLATSQGTLSLNVPGSFAYPAGLPGRTSPHELVLPYAITQGTGAYAGLTGTGVVEFIAARGDSHGGFAGDGRLGIRFTHLNPTN